MPYLSDTEKEVTGSELGLEKADSASQARYEVLSAKVASLEKHLQSSEPEILKSTTNLTLFGMVIGSLIPDLIPKKWVKDNKMINQYWMKNGQYDPGKTLAFSTIIGTATGAIIDLFRFNKRQGENTIKMQEMITDKRQEVTSQRTR